MTTRHAIAMLALKRMEAQLEEARAACQEVGFQDWCRDTVFPAAVERWVAQACEAGRTGRDA